MAGDYRTRSKGAQTRRRRLHRCHGESAHCRCLDTDCANSAHREPIPTVFRRRFTRESRPRRVRLGGRTTVPGGIAHVIWVACMSYARSTTTNNYAVYQGLLNGLKATQRHKWTPIHVIGDSQLIIRQHREWRLQKSASLKTLYRQTMRLAAELDVQSWAHHYRHFNKMADQAANTAMDSSSSRQWHAHDTAIPANIVCHLREDVDHWNLSRAIKPLQLHLHWIQQDTYDAS